MSKEIKLDSDAVRKKHREFNDWLEEIQESCPVDWRWLDGESSEWVDYRFYDKVTGMENEDD